jgi:hypothetical protein
MVTSRVPATFQPSASRVPTGFAATAPSRVPSGFGQFTPSAATFGVGSGGSSLAEYRQSFLGRAMAAQQAAALQEAGLPPDADPALLTQGTAEGQTNAALAKIATANPELAEALAAKREGKPDTSDGWWDDVKDAVGDLLDPVVAIGAKALDLITRPARIIPELIVDKEDDPWYADITQALSGKSHATGADVLDKWGVDNSWARAIGGFAFDIAADPLTWLTFGGAAVGRQVLTRTLGETVFTGVAKRELGEAGARTLAKEATDVDTWVRTAYKEAKSYGFSTDAAEAVAGQAFNRLGAQGYRRALEAHQRVTQLFQTGGLKSLLKEGGGITLTDGYRLEGMEVLNWLNTTRKANLGSRQTWQAAKAAAGAQGGIRFRAALPFTSLRYISPAIPGTEGLQFFGSMRRYITGNAGVKRLNKAVVQGQYGAKLDDLDTFVREGWKGLSSTNPDLVAHLGTRGGSIFYPASEALGRLTRRMTPQGQALRGGGIMALHTDDFRRAMDGYRAQLREKLSGTLYKWNDQAQDFDKTRELRTAREIDDLLKGMGDDPARHAIQYNYMELVPAEARGDIAGWYNQKLAGLDPEADLDEIEYWTKRRDKALEADAALAPQERKIAELLADQQEAGRRELERDGVLIPDVTRDFDRRGTLVSEEARIWSPFNSVHARMDDGSPLEVFVEAEGNAAAHGFTQADARPVRVGKGPSRPAPEGPRQFKPVSYEDFERAQTTLGKQKIRKDRQPFLTWADSLTPEEKASTRVFLNDAGDAGYGLSADNEIVMVWNAGESGKAARLLEEAVAEGGTHLNHFDSGLTKLYDDLGFKETGRQGFNDDYAPEGWDFEGLGRPDYIRRDIEPMGQPVPVHGFGGSTVPDNNRVRAVVRTIKPFVVDERAGATQSGAEFIEDVRKRSDDIIDGLLGNAKWVEGHKRVGIDITEPGELARFKEEAFAQKLAAEVQAVHGADSLIWYAQDGTKTVTVFDRANIKAINNAVPKTPVMRGYVHRSETDAWLRWIQGNKDADLPRNWKRIKERLETRRAFIREDTDAAEEAIFNDLRAAGIDMTDAPKTIFERDIRKIHGKWVDRAVEAGVTSQGEWAGRKLGAQMEMALGRPLGLQQVRWKSADASPRVLMALGDDVLRAATKVSQVQEDYMSNVHFRRRTKVGDVVTLYRGEDPTYTGPGFLGFQRSPNDRAGKLWMESLWADEDPLVALPYGAHEAENVTQIMLKPEARVLRHTKVAGENPQQILEQAYKDGYDAVIFDKNADIGSAILNPDAIYHKRKMTAKQLDNRVDWLDAREERALRDATKANQERERVMAKFQSYSSESIAALERVDVAPAGFMPVEGIPGLEGLSMPGYMAEEVHRALRGPQGVSEMRRYWRRFAMGPWKRWSTVYYPGFHVRNTMGAFFNNAIGGVTDYDYVLSYRIRRASSTKANKWNDVSIGGNTAVVPKKTLQSLGLDTHPYFKGKDNPTWRDLSDFIDDHNVTAQSSGWISEYELSYGSKEADEIFPAGRAKLAGQRAAASKAGTGSRCRAPCAYTGGSANHGRYGKLLPHRRLHVGSQADRWGWLRCSGVHHDEAR